MSLLAIKVAPGESAECYQHFDVPEEVYTYVRQLEYAVYHRNSAALERLYPNRFPKNRDR